jgi:hypothetical protein
VHSRFFKNKAKVLLTNADIFSNIIRKRQHLNGGSEMNKQEFFDLVNCGANFLILDEDWEALQTVYNYHPMISDVNGKSEIAALYNQGGFGLIYDMLPTARLIEENEAAIQKARVNIENGQKEFEIERRELEQQFENMKQSNLIDIQKRQEEIELICERYPGN